MNISKRQYIVFTLDKTTFIPFDKIRGPITIEPIHHNNIPDVSVLFPSGKIQVFYEKLHLGHIGAFARHKDDVVGYMWRKDYNTSNNVYADGYIPLNGHFSHLHFARVSEGMRGRGLQLLMFTYLIRDAFSLGIPKIYTDGDQDNIISIRGTTRIGFHEEFRLIVFELFRRKFPLRYIGDGNPLGGNDNFKKILFGKAKSIFK
jgi:hypothetical protein